MFEKYGEFDSADELNVAAATALEQGDKDAVMALAAENGIEAMDAEDYIGGCVAELCTPIMAAVGKLNVEKQALKLPSMMEYWFSQLNEMLLDDPALTEAVRKKGKRITALFGKLLKASSESRKVIPAEITKAAGLSGNIYVGDVDRLTFKKMVNDYYLN